MSDSIISITCVGDVFPANLSYNRNCGVASLCFDDNHRYKYVQRLRALLDESDYLICNLESPILPGNLFSKEMQFAGHPAFVKLLKESNFNIISIANNHIYEWGLSGIDSTVLNLKNNQLTCIGINESNGKPKVHFAQIEELTLAFVAFNAIDNVDGNDVISEYKVERVIDCIKEIKEISGYSVDYVFVILHWGDEFIQRPSPMQIGQAHSIIDAGAQFVICSHPHVIQPVEEYHGGLICYSLGNFIFDMTIPSTTKVGMVLNLRLRKGSFTHHESYVKISKDFFPRQLDKPYAIDQTLHKQKEMMANYSSIEYELQYNKEKRNRRIKKRILEKWLLIKNWGKYTPAIRRDFIKHYIKNKNNGKD